MGLAVLIVGVALVSFVWGIVITVASVFWAGDWITPFINFMFGTPIMDIPATTTTFYEQPY